MNFELNKIGLEMINVNIHDITDESGYIEALGQKAASEAVNKAKVEVADADRQDVIGSATAKREMDVEVAEQGALMAEGRKKAEAHHQVEIAEFEAAAIKSENESRAKMAVYNVELAEREAETKRRGEVTLAEASRDVLRAEKDEELARLEKQQIAQQMVEHQKIEIDTDAEAERLRRVAAGEADTLLAKYTADAEGIRKALEAKACGYERLITVCSERKDLAPPL